MPGPTALTESDLWALVEGYRAATRRAVAAGFDVIDVHAAHAAGWDLWSDQFRYWLERRAKTLKREGRA